MRVKVAESVPAGQVLLDLVNPASLRGQLFVPAGWVTWLRPNMAFEVRVKDTGRTYRARVAKLNARIDGVSQQLELEARFEGSGEGLLPVEGGDDLVAFAAKHRLENTAHVELVVGDEDASDVGSGGGCGHGVGSLPRSIVGGVGRRAGPAGAGGGSRPGGGGGRMGAGGARRAASAARAVSATRAASE